ncbi:hypothetical protein CMV_030275 [Castanea mollissima]|uniref:Uncharacterized protein n=1 Tax=Castanea mollissima TaxID=60419 RepID=A0A8J4QCS4_9ROSI|nr:hypothetical protein CMV_030275 [Castanea mollissima]
MITDPQLHRSTAPSIPAPISDPQHHRSQLQSPIQSTTDPYSDLRSTAPILSSDQAAVFAGCCSTTIKMLMLTANTVATLPQISLVIHALQWKNKEDISCILDKCSLLLIYVVPLWNRFPWMYFALQVIASMAKDDEGRFCHGFGKKECQVFERRYLCNLQEEILSQLIKTIMQPWRQVFHGRTSMEKGGHLRLMNLDGKVLVPNFLLLIIEDVSCILAIRSLLLIYVISLECKIRC